MKINFLFCVLSLCCLFSILAPIDASAFQSIDPPPKTDPNIMEFYKQKIERLKSLRDSLIESLDEQKAQIDIFEQRQRTNDSMLDEISVSPASFENVVRLLHTQKVQLTIDLAGLKARQLQLTEYYEGIKSTSTNTTNKLASQLQKLVETQQKHYDTVKKQVESGTVPTTVLTKAKKELLEAQIRLLQNQQQSKPGNVVGVGELLTNAMLDHVEKQAKLDTITEILANYNKARTIINSAKKIDDKTKMAEAKLGDLEERLVRTEQQIKQFELEYAEYLKDPQNNDSDK